ncbi:MAG: hypothetical protein J6M05_06760 [Cardiobacteriaceae bacterium]|nr:hypothetical protein [Cardiobacteriaceae bacterium]
MENQTDVKKLLEYCINNINNEIVEALISGNSGNKNDIRTVNILITIRQQLCNMRHFLSPNLYTPSYSYILRDQPNVSAIGNDLLTLISKYNQLE